MHFLPPQSGAADPMAPSKVGGRLASGHRIAVTAASRPKFFATASTIPRVRLVTRRSFLPCLARFEGTDQRSEGPRRRASRPGWTPGCPLRIARSR